MTEILKIIEFIEDKRQEKKVRHKLLDIVVIVLFAMTVREHWCRNHALAFGCNF